MTLQQMIGQLPTIEDLKSVSRDYIQIYDQYRQDRTDKGIHDRLHDALDALSGAMIGYPETYWILQTMTNGQRYVILDRDGAERTGFRWESKVRQVCERILKYKS